MTDQHSASPAGAPGSPGTATDPLAEAPRASAVPLPGDGEEPDLPDTPATMADVTAWLLEAIWCVPGVNVSLARFEEWGSTRVAAAAVDAGAIVVVLDNDQVVRLAPVLLTLPSGDARRPFTVNPPGRSFTHASLGGAPLCERITGGDKVSEDWAGVTCLDCQLAAPAPVQRALDGLDLAWAERQIGMVLTAASPLPLATYDVLVRIDRELRAITPDVLAQMAVKGTIIQISDPDCKSPGWLPA